MNNPIISQATKRTHVASGRPSIRPKQQTMEMTGVTGENGTLKERGRAENSVAISPLVDPLENGPSGDELKRWRDTGADRIVLLSQKTVAATANGDALELIKRFSAVVERNRAI